MIQFGPEEITLNNGKKVLIQSLELIQVEKIALSVGQFAQEVTHNQMDTGFILGELKKRWDSATLFLGAFDESQLIAYLSLRRPFPDRPWAMHIAEFGFMILSDYWGQGIGTKFLQIVESIAKKEGIHRLEAKVRINNQRATNLYIRNHYLIEGKRRYAAYINGEYEDEYYIAKII